MQTNIHERSTLISCIIVLSDLSLNFKMKTRKNNNLEEFNARLHNYSRLLPENSVKKKNNKKLNKWHYGNGIKRHKCAYFKNYVDVLRVHVLI